MDKFSENKLKQFSNFAGKYNTGKYAGREELLHPPIPLHQ